MYKIDLLNAKSWDELPNPWKVVNVAKKNIPKWSSPMEEAVVKLFEPYFATDALRPSITALHVDDLGYVATDSHRLLFINKKGNTSFAEGNYLISSKVAKKTKKKVGSIINEKYPDYRVILNDSVNFSDAFDGRFLKTYCEAMIKGEYVHPVSKSIKFEINYGEYVFLNAESVIEMVNTFQQLGIERIYVGYNQYNRGVYFSNNRANVSSPKSSIRNPDCILVLLMPLMEIDRATQPFGCVNIDKSTSTSSEIYFSFTHGGIYNANTIQANFDVVLKTKNVPYITENKLSLLKRLAGKNKKLPIADCVMVQNGVAVATNLREQISVNGVDVEDGIYEILSDAFKNTAYKIIDFPDYLTRVSSNMVLITEFEASKIQPIIKEAKNFVSDDDLRPALMGITFNAQDSKKVKIYASNSYILYSNAIYSKRICELNNAILYPENLSFYLDSMSINNGLVKMNQYLGNDTIFLFESDDSSIQYVTESSSVTPPKFEEVLKSPLDSEDKKMELEKGVLNAMVNGLTKEEIKSGKILIFEYPSEDYVNVTSTQNVKVYVGEFDKNNGFKKDRVLGGFPIKITPNNSLSFTDYHNVNCAMIMPITDYNNKVEYGYNPQYLKEILSISQDDSYIYLNTKKLGQLFVFSELKTSIPLPSAPQTSKKEDIQKIMKGLEILVKRGNKIAETKLKAYAIIIKRI
jgi:hypothetical protein